MALLDDIVEEATAKDGDVPRLLRLCMRLAARLEHEQLGRWARHELEGYPDSELLPEYRVLSVRNMGAFVLPMASGEHILEIPVSILPKELQAGYSRVNFKGAIAEYIDLVAPEVGKQSEIVIPWPLAHAVHHATKVVRNSGAQCQRAWMEVSPSRVVGMIDQIKTRVLAFALEIQKVVPNADVKGRSTKFQGVDRVTQIFNTTISGNVQNYAAGSSSFSQAAVSNVQRGDWASLSSALTTAGVQQADLASLRDAVDASPNNTNEQEIRIRDWLARLTAKAGQGLAGIGPDVVAGVVTQAVLIYLGIA